jgi:hypothetical protein
VLDDFLALREQARNRQHKDFPMTDRPEPKNAKKDAKEPGPIIHIGMIGDGTEEQNLGERGDPAKRIEEDEVDAAFNQPAPKKKR